MRPNPSAIGNRRARVQFAALLKVQAKLSVREPYALGLGVGLPAVLLVVFLGLFLMRRQHRPE